METHAHHLHKAPGKSFRHYFFEFFMLFLAVFSGFLAENQREHIVEHEREKKFARRLLSDLREDSNFLQNRIDKLERRQKAQAHFMAVMTNPIKSTDSAVMSDFSSLQNSFPSEFTTTTYNQMKASGSLRYIRNDSVITELQRYYEIIVPRASSDAEGVEKVWFEYVLPYITKHFRFQDLTSDVPSKYALLNRTAESDQELINIMGAYGAGCNAILDRQKPALKKVQELIMR